MMRALYTAATGMIAEQANVDNIAHNLANVNTTGYKTERVEFKSLLYQTLQSKTTTANGDPKPVGAQVGLGTRVAATTSMYTQGSLLSSESDTDFAIEGEGFFAIRDIDGEIYYTKSGNFTWAMDGQGGTILTNTDGNPVMDTNGQQIVVPDGIPTENMYFDKSGNIGYLDGNGNYVDMNQQFALYQFNNPEGLEKLSDSRLEATAASGDPMLESANPNLNQSKVHQYYLEGSNVNVADEMVNMIIAQRAYELNSKAITTSDSMLDTANQLKR